MPNSTRPRLTLTEARSSRTADLVDQLVDAPAVTAASIIRQLDRHRVNLALLHVVTSVDERWRFHNRQQDTTLQSLDEALLGVLLASGDALEVRRRNRQLGFA